MERAAEIHGQRGRRILNGGDAVIIDFQGQAIRLPYERWLHITDPTGPHPYMVNLRAESELTLQDPDLITRSNKDPERVRIYQKWIRNTAVGDKWVRVIVQFFDNGDAFVLTAFASRARYSGERLWPKE